MRRVTPLAERVFAKVDMTLFCWEWKGAVCRYTGYGKVGLGRRGDGVGYVHRVVYQMLVGPVPEGMDLDHLCRNRACCNPDHLEPVTRSENNRRGALSRRDLPRANWRDYLPQKVSA